MSKADELLRGLTDEQRALYSGAGSGTEEPHIVIGRDRKIIVPESLRRIAVEGDHDIETFTFDCPRYWDEHDLSKMILYINYRLPDGNVGSYIAENITVVDDDTFTFTWTISRTISQKKGNIACLVCAKGTELLKAGYLKGKIISGDNLPNFDSSVYIENTITGEGVYADPNWSGTENGRYYCVDDGVYYDVILRPDDVIAETRHWNTELCTDMYVSEGLEADPIVEEDYPDILTQLLERMTVVEKINIQKEEMEALLLNAVKFGETSLHEANSILAEIRERESNINDSAAEIRNSYANAIEGKVSGEIVRVDDVSPLEHDVEVKVRGKNLIPFPYAGGEGKVTNGITFTRLSDGGILINGTNSHSTYVEYPLVTTNSLTINANQLTMSLYGPETNDIYCTIGGGGFGFYEVKSGTSTVLNGNGTSQIFTYGLLRVKAGATVSNVTVYPMLNEGSMSLPYESYVDPTTIEVSVCGKNIFPYPFNGTVYGNGITFTNNNGSVTLNGTNDGTSNSVFYIAKDAYITLPAGTYSCSPNLEDISIMGVEKGGGYHTFCSVNKKQFTLTEPTTYRSIYIQILKGTTKTFNNVTVRPMLEYGDTEAIFESYVGESYIPESDGSCIVKSVNPSMTIFTDTPGVTVEAIYNRDTTKVFDSYALTEEAIRGIANDIKSVVDEEIDAIEDTLQEIIEIQEKLI